MSLQLTELGAVAVVMLLALGFWAGSMRARSIAAHKEAAEAQLRDAGRDLATLRGKHETLLAEHRRLENNLTGIQLAIGHQHLDIEFVPAKTLHAHYRLRPQREK